MVPVWSVLYWFRRMLAERWKYNWSGADYGNVSCAGAWVYIFRQWGKGLYHGSNTIWRKHTGHKGKLKEVTPVPGWAVFKWREDGEPEQYERDGLDDFYHMGCFVGPTASHPEGAVIEAKGTKWGVVETSIRDGWSHAAEMAGVDYSATEAPMAITGHVTAQSGKTVNLRKQPSADAIVLLRVPLRTEAEILDITDGWARVRVDGQTGYMLERFLDRADTSVEPDDSDGGGDDTSAPLSQAVEHIAALIEQQQAALRDIDRQLGAAVELLAGLTR